MVEIVPDSEHRATVTRLPTRAADYIQLARLDRPIGAWLLYWPGAWAIALAGHFGANWPLLLWFALGAVAMRGAGCVYNDLVDRDLDARVARTRSRPIASGRVSLKAAWLWLFLLCFVGLIVLLQLDRTAQIFALASLAPVAAYPFMKRITWWPQAWLGIVFSWAALVGGPAALGRLDGATGTLYAGSIFWVIGYDTIYALQDIEDDALAGIKSSARALGRHARAGVAVCYALAVALWTLALWQRRPDPLVWLALVPAALHLGWQIAALNRADPADALAKFRANRFAGLLVFLACLTVGAAST